MSDLARMSWTPYSECPCGCETIGWKLQAKTGHVVGCSCRSCIGRRNKRKGSAANSRAHKRLGGVGQMVNDDIFHAYPLEVSLEVKTGTTEIPAKFLEFSDSKWLRDALFQATKKVPEGIQAYPAVMLEISPSRAFLVVDCSGRAS